MTANHEDLQQVAVQVRGLVDRIAALFGRTSEVPLDAPTPAAQTAGDSEYDGWTYLVRVPVPPDAVDRLDGPVRRLLEGEGFETVDRDSPTEIARQFRARGVDLGVQVARSGRGDVVIGASAGVAPTD